MKLALAVCLAVPLWAAPRAMYAAAPVMCPSGAPLGSFAVTVTPPGGGTPIPLEKINQLLPGYRVSWTPARLNATDKKKARVSLILVPSDRGKVKVFDPQPAGDAVEWTIPSRTEIAAVAYGPQGLDRGKVDKLIAKDDEIIGQLADYAKKTEQTQALIQAITQQQQSLATGQNVDAAVVGFANQYSGTKIDRTLPADQQMLTLVRSVNPALSAYDPLAQNPAARASQTAGLAAAVAGLFFGTDVGLAASSGALLVNMHSLVFPNTEFRSAFAQPVPDRKDQTALCGNKTPSASRTELAFLWATRVPDSNAPEIALKKTVHLPIGAKSPVEVTVKARDNTLLARVEDWKLASADGKVTTPVPVKVNTETKTLEIDAAKEKLTPGTWKLAGSWDWTPLAVGGDIDLRTFSTFDRVRLAAASHDELTPTHGKCVARLEGDDFEFVEKLAYKNADDKFAQPVTLPFHLPKGPRAGSEMTLETQLDPKAMGPGRYEFLIAQSDGKEHEVPFQVLPDAPQIANLPLMVNQGAASEEVGLQGTGLDRIESLTGDRVQIKLGGDGKTVAVTLDPSVKAGDRIALSMKVKDFVQPVTLANAIAVAGPRPAITGVRPSQATDPGVALKPGEIAAGSYVSFALDVANAPNVSGVRLSCGGLGGPTVKARQEAAGTVFLSFRTSDVGETGCRIEAEVQTPGSGSSLPRVLGTVVRVPRIDAFSVSDQKAGDNTYAGILKGQDLDAIERVGWDAAVGSPVTAIPAPVAGGGSETLQIAVPWPAPSPHAPLYVWLRGESSGRVTGARL